MHAAQNEAYVCMCHLSWNWCIIHVLIHTIHCQGHYRCLHEFSFTSDQDCTLNASAIIGGCGCSSEFKRDPSSLSVLSGVPIDSSLSQDFGIWWQSLSSIYLPHRMCYELWHSSAGEGSSGVEWRQTRLWANEEDIQIWGRTDRMWKKT